MATPPGWGVRGWIPALALLAEGGCAQVLGFDKDYRSTDSDGTTSAGADEDTGSGATTSSSGTSTSTNTAPVTWSAPTWCGDDGDCTDPREPRCCAGTCVPAVAEIAAGWYHFCALETDGTLWCWGDNRDGQLGDGVVGSTSSADQACSFECSLLPVQVKALGNTVRKVVAGGFFTCAIDDHQALWCWGQNAFGQIGDDTKPDSPVPAPQHVADGVLDVAAGGYHACLIKDDRLVRCWGDNDRGQLGNGTTWSTPVPMHVKDLGEVDRIWAGAEHTCALAPYGVLWCWGLDREGQLGDGRASTGACVAGPCAMAPVQMTAIPAGVVSASPGGDLTCGLMADHSAWCWGATGHGELGLGDAEGGGQTCGVEGPCKGTPQLVAALGKRVALVAAGYAQACAVDSADGTLWCWGSNESGQLGDGTLEDKHSPVQIAPLADTVVRVAMGSEQTCVLQKDHTVWCWGRNDNGELGDGTADGDQACANGFVCKPRPVRARIGECP